jgi:anti-sigma factor ChrR (cupin superfamily)
MGEHGIGHAPVKRAQQRDHLGRQQVLAKPGEAHDVGEQHGYRLLTGFGKLTTRLLEVRAGVALPSHTHAGIELTLVLQGGCLCLAVTDAPLRLTGRLGRMLNPFLRI